MNRPVHRFFFTLAAILASGSFNIAQAQSVYTWDSAVTGNRWLDNLNWDLVSGGGNLSGYPGTVADLLSTNSDIAQFLQMTAASTSLRIDMSIAGGSLALGAIDVNTASTATPLTIASTTSSGTLILNGATVNGIDKTLIAVRGSRALSIRDNFTSTSPPTLTLQLGITDGIMYVAPGQSLNLISVISERTPGSRINFTGGGNALLWQNNTFSGGVSASGGTTLVIFSNENQLGSVTAPTPGAVTLDNATLKVLANGSFVAVPFNANRGFAIGPGGATIDYDNDNITIAGNITNTVNGGGRLRLVGNSTFGETATFSGMNDFSGGLTLEKTILSISSDANLGAVPATTSADALIFSTISSLRYSGPSGSIHSNRGIKSDSLFSITVVNANTVLTYGGVISNLGASSAILNVSGPGTLSLHGPNTYSGTTSTTGTLQLDFNASGAPLNNILPTTTTIRLFGAGATLDVVGGNGGNSHAQSLTGYEVAIGYQRINATSVGGGSLDLNLGTLSLREAGSVLKFTRAGSGSIIVNGTPSTIIAATDGTAFAIDSTLDWAARDASNHVVPGSTVPGFFTPTTSTSLSGNADVASGTNTTLASSASVNSLRFSLAETRSISVNSGQILTVGGILVMPGVGANTSTISGGTVKGPGTDLVIFQHNTEAPLRIESTITSAVTKAGEGTIVVTSTNSYTGATRVHEGAFEAGAENAFSPSSTISVGWGARVRLMGHNQTVANITATLPAGTAPRAVVENGGSDPAVLTLGNSSSVNLVGTVQDGGPGSLALVKVGSGTVSLSNLGGGYSGGTTIRAGTLTASSAGLGTGPVVVGINSVVTATPTLVTRGTLGAALTITGNSILGLDLTSTFSPLNANESVTFMPSAKLRMRIRDDGSADLINVGETILEFQSIGAVKPILVLDNTLGLTSTQRSWALISLDEGSGLLLNGVTVADHQELGRTTVGGVSTGPLTIDTSGVSGLVSGDMFFLNRIGDDVVLNYTPIPEPATGGLVASLGCFLIIAQRGWRRYKRGFSRHIRHFYPVW